MNKKKQMAFNLNNFLLSMSQALDSVENRVYNTSEHHSKRVAYIALKLALEFNYKKEGLFDICAYSLCHNIALNKTKKINKEYCELSNEYANKLPFISEQKDVLKYQAEHYDGSGVYGLKEHDIPLFSQFISFANILDTKFDLSKSSIDNRKEILSFIKAEENKLFSSDMIECFEEFSKSTSFWLDLQNENDIMSFIFSKLQDFTIVLDFEEILDITKIFAKLLDDERLLLESCEKLADFYDFEHKDKQVFLIAASLSKLGKLFIDESILNKKDTLSQNEYEVIKSYPYYTKKILSNIIGFADIVSLSSMVQERIDGKGYPFNYKAKDLSLKHRVLACLLVYSSLLTKKSFRNEYTHEKAIEIMNKMSEKGVLDSSIVSDIDKTLK